MNLSLLVLRHRLRRVPLSVMVVGVIFTVIVLAAIFAPLLAPVDPTRQQLLARLKPPGYAMRGVTYWLGTDDLGRDLLSRTLYGAGVSLGVAVLSVVVSSLVGVTLGMAAGWFRGWVEIVIMRLVDS